jgi:tetratricopeptide (TPR) repeat protein
VRGRGEADEGAESRIYRLLQAEDPTPAGREAVAAADRELRDGRPARALSLIAETLRVLVDSGCSEHVPELLDRALRGGLALGTTGAFDRVVYLVQRSGLETRKVGAVEAIARAALLVLSGDCERALRMVEDCGYQEEPPMERYRLSVKVMAARLVSLEREAAIVDEVSHWAASHADPAVRASLLEWRGWVAYRREDYREAAELHLECARQSDCDSARLSALLNAASAALEDGDFDLTHDLAAEAAGIARANRHVFQEARAECIERRAAYRTGRAETVDHELLEAFEALNATYLEALLGLNEAAVAWRAERRAEARKLADRAWRLWEGMGQTVGADLARALAVRLGTDVPADELAAIVDRNLDGELPGISAQVLALIVPALPSPAEAVAAVRRIAADLEETRERPREVLSLAEALELVEVAPGGNRG